MKLYTCFRAYEASTAHLEALAIRGQYGTNRWEHLLERQMKIRDGLIRRMERTEGKVLVERREKEYWREVASESFEAKADD